MPKSKGVQKKERRKRREKRDSENWKKEKKIGHESEKGKRYTGVEEDRCNIHIQSDNADGESEGYVYE
jgi:hypothetical protein